MAQDLNPLPWGAQDRYQAHFIVRVENPINSDDFIAKTRIQTAGHFAQKKVAGVEWVGGEIAEKLNSDSDLKSMILKLPYQDTFIWVEPTKKGIRIHGRWKSSQELGITKELFEVYDRIASHVKKTL
ncbi:MAG: hypothetical protein KGI25_09620 [Thaumarchaeota archaeon]|nr:hypothetical protein [Nitrososphaerota archaeon]